MLGIIDADSIIWKAGKISAAMEDNDHGIACALHNVNLLMGKIISRCQLENYKVYIGSTDHSNFRYKVYDKYKCSRVKVEKPIHFNKIYEYLITKYSAEVVFGEEAEDRAAQTHYALNNHVFEDEPTDIIRSMLIHIDKDLNQLAGYHYNYTKDIFYWVPPLEGLKSFYRQLLTGDTADDIPRVSKGWKKKDAFALIDVALNESELFDIVKNVFYNEHNATIDNFEVVDDLILQRGQLLWLNRNQNEMWQIPNFDEGCPK